MPGILVFVEQRDGVFRNSGLEAMSEGRRLADAMGVCLVGAVVGHGLGALPASLGRYGADRVLVADTPELAQYSSDGHIAALDAMTQTIAPSIILLAATVTGRALGAGL
ncbi:MAG: electron transfer flavoprotein subunit alpha/FixB family protein, partial [candidate division Zixibacteria bacterium]|nr:electron transfer flavoprotein subunit alpha/FixB family protein [candidate division Zixibacteria bacterium]